MSSHKEKIDAIIDVKKASNFINHLLSNFYFSDQIITDKQHQSYKLWKSDRWSRLMYSVFHITFNQEGSIVKIHEEINPLGKLIKYFYLGFVLFFYAYLIYDTFLYPPDEFYWGYFIPPLAILVFFYAVYKGVGFGRKMLKNRMIDHLKIVIGLETTESLKQKNDLKSELTRKKTLTRLILYPLCIFLIFVSLYMLLIDNAPKSSKSYSAGLYALGLSFTYLAVDIIILIKKRK